MPPALVRAGRPPARGRHAARHGAGVRRGPLWSVLATAHAVKGGAGVGLTAGVAAILLVPGPSVAQTRPGTPDEAAAFVDPALAREAPGRAARSAVRTSRTGPVAISAPPAVAAIPPDRVGVSGLRAVPRATASSSPSAATFSSGAYAAQAAGLGLGPNAARVYSAVRSAFGITTIGGYRPGDSGDHGAGRAVDIMISGQGQGDAVAAFVQAHAAEFHVTYVIWRQRIWYPGSAAWQPMADRGSVTANHYDHVHVSVS